MPEPHNSLSERLRCASEALILGLVTIALLLPLLGFSSLASYIVTHTSPMAYAILFYGFMALAVTRLVWPLVYWYRAGGHKILLTVLRPRSPMPPTLPHLPLREEILPWLGRTFVLFIRVVGYILRGLPSTLGNSFTPTTPEGRRHLVMLASMVVFAVLTHVMGRVLDEPPAFTDSFMASSLIVSGVGGLFIYTCWNLFDPRARPTQPQRFLSAIYACGVGLWAASAVRSLLPASMVTDVLSVAVWILLIPTLLAFVYQCSSRGIKGFFAHLGSLMDNPS